MSDEPSGFDPQAETKARQGQTPNPISKVMRDVDLLAKVSFSCTVLVRIYQ
jgi:hypothetical protein